MLWLILLVWTVFDTGGITQGLVHPVLVGSGSDKLMAHLSDTVEGIKPELIESAESGNGTVLLRCRVKQTTE